MRRFFIFILCFLMLTTAVCAAGTVSDMQNTTVISSDGSCEVTLIFTITHDGSGTPVRYPLPADAYNITVNGSPARTSQEYLTRWVDLSKIVAGGISTVTMHYTIPDRVTNVDGDLTLTIPLLSGFSYAIDNLQYTITMPGPVEGAVSFSSTYHPESMDALMDYTVEDQVIAGRVTQQLMDHEALSVVLSVSDKMFPQAISKQWSMSNLDLIMYALAVAAVLYWLIFLRCAPPRRVRCTQPIDGLTAGELGCCLTGQGVDFTAMVLSWAQMGYLSIRIDRSRRVLLQKRMDMGNERSDLEVRCFKTLFGNRHTVDGGGEYFARLGRRLSRTVHGSRHYFRKSWGNPNVFRVLCAGIGLFAGISLAFAFVSDTGWRIVLSILLGAAGGAAAWMIQSAGRCLHLRKKYTLLIAAGCSILWFILSRFAGEAGVAIFMICSQFLGGLASAYGGRRTEEGKQVMSEVLGLRRYLKSISSRELQAILERDPDYYFSLIPFAFAFGIDRSFSHKLGNLPVNGCLYLYDDRHPPKTAHQWCKLLREATAILDARQMRPFSK